MSRRGRGRRRPARFHGALLIDKPAGLTSHDVVARVRQLTGQPQVGHTGTLDPLATGLLPLLLGEATRLSAFVTAEDKTYEATARLGETTDTLDAEGQLLERRPLPDQLDGAHLEAALGDFRGTLTQQVPAFSAVKVDGERLYKRARAGKDVERPVREITIHRLTLVDWRPPALDLEICCSKGTYIRQLAADLGDTLGCGAHLTALRRTTVGPFGLGESVTLDALQGSDDALPGALITARDFVESSLPCIGLDDEGVARTRQGQRLGWARLACEPLAEGCRFALVTDTELIAIAEARADDYTLSRVIPQRSA